MLERTIFRISNILKRSGRLVGPIKVGIFLALLLPIFFMIYRDHQMSVATANDLVFSRREAISDLAATLLTEKFDGIVNIGVVLATQPEFQDKVRSSNWSEAVQNLEHARKNNTSIDNIVLFSPDGTIQAVTPPIPEIIGKNFSYRDYYIGVSKDWKPYVSEVFKRSIPPYDNIISVAVPIQDTSSTTTDNSVLGILLFTIKLDTILDWAQEVDVGSDGFVYFTDQHGNVAGHPKYSDDKEVVSFSSVPVVQQALKGEQGVTISYNPVEQEERIAGYKQLKPYGWTVIVQQPTRTAFALTQASIKNALIEDIILGSISAVLLFFLINLFFTIYKYHQKEQIYLSSVGDGLIGIDRSWNIMLWNKAATELTGWDESEAVGKPFREIVNFIHEDTREENIRFIEETMLFGKINFMSNHTLLKKKSGEEISVGDSASPILNANGTVEGAIIIFRDTSKERELEKSREEFASLATHQLRTPITIINQYVELLADETDLSVVEKEELEAIKKASRSLADLVNAMLNVSRIETGTIGIYPQPVFLPDIAQQVVKELAPQFAKKKIALDTSYAVGLPPINADEKLFGAMCKNLLSNALKYTPDGGKVTLSLNKNSADVVLSVVDNGLGIPQSQQSHIFTKFFRADNVRSADISGTGLGLYTIKAILKQSGGNIWFESTEGQGSAFHVSIPLTGMNKKEGMKGLT